MRDPGSTRLSVVLLLWVMCLPTALVLGTAAALSDEPGRIVVQEEPDRFANRPFFRDTTLELHPRTYYYDRDKLDGTINQAWAGGGWLAYHSGLLANTFHIGLTYFTSNPIIAPEEVVEVDRQFAGPKRIEGLLVNFLGALRLAHVFQ